MRPAFCSKTTPAGLGKTMSAFPILPDQEMVPDFERDSDPGDNLDDHIQFNFDRFLEKFSAFKPNPVTGFLQHDERDPLSILFANYVTSYKYVIPHLYRLDGLVQDLSTTDLFSRLNQVESVVEKALFTSAALHNCVYRCAAQLSIPVSCESTLKSQIQQLVSNVFFDIAIGPEYIIANRGEVISGAAGVLCAPNGDRSSLDPNAGFAGNVT